MEFEKAFEKVDRIRMDFFDSKYKDVHTEDELAEKYEALCTILQYIKYDSIPKKKIEDTLIKKQVERKPYWEQNDIMLNCVGKKTIEVTVKDLEINDKSMQLYGAIKVLQELLEEDK